MHLVDDLRISPFFPIDKISPRSKLHLDFIANGGRNIRQTSWGSLEVRNRLLTQSHLEIFSLIMANKKESKQLKSGRIAIYFSMYDIAKKISEGEWSGRKSDELEERIRQIADCKMVRRYKDGSNIDYSIISNVGYSKSSDMWGIVLSDEYSQLFKHSVTIGYSKRLDEIIAIKGEGSGLVKAVIHFFLTHNNTRHHKITLIQLLETIGYPTDDRMLRRAITSLNKAKEPLKEFNIFFYVKDRIVEYIGAGHIKFLPALPMVK